MNYTIKNKENLVKFGWFYLLTGVFAIIGSLFSWGNGWLFSQNSLIIALLPAADLILTGPISIASAVGIWQRKNWGIYLGLISSGIYLFGSVLVYIIVIWAGPPYPLHLVIPPLFGFAIAVLFFIEVTRNTRLL